VEEEGGGRVESLRIQNDEGIVLPVLGVEMREMDDNSTKGGRKPVQSTKTK